MSGASSGVCLGHNLGHVLDIRGATCISDPVFLLLQKWEIDQQSKAYLIQISKHRGNFFWRWKRTKVTTLQWRSSSERSRSLTLFDPSASQDRFACRERRPQKYSNLKKGSKHKIAGQGVWRDEGNSCWMGPVSIVAITWKPPLQDWKYLIYDI